MSIRLFYGSSILIVSLFGGLATSPASASSLLASSFATVGAGTFSAGGGVFNGPPPLVSVFNDSQGDYSFATANGLVTPSVSAGVVSAPDQIESDAQATLSYQFEIVQNAPDNAPNVPVMFDVGLSVFTTDQFASGGAQVGIPGIVDFYCSTNGSSDCGTPDSCPDPLCQASAQGYEAFLVLNAGVPYTINLLATVAAFNAFQDNFVSADATADPYIYINPTFNDASDYSIIVSDGIGNSPVVPEPRESLSLTFGLLAMFLVRRQQRRTRPR
jgi:hypothetical protein